MRKTMRMKAAINVQNLESEACANTIISRLMKLAGIKNLTVDLESSQVRFDYDTLNDLAMAERTLVNLGYPPEGIANNLISKTKSYVTRTFGKLN